ncbi:uncharacterized protein LOC113283825 isoform X1 [Papaver somniferum]|uniref:uncharacterized protein LOC113283825 isoform X1 n=1 Tax=Papaver somniferum TaxID=3469 RepID=UPI000E6FAD96|nr:uncharacterized protein LOC113283825 isoform X1 [Papaver somniferum]
MIHFVFIDTTSTPKKVGFTRGLALDVQMNANKGKLVVLFSELNGEPLCDNGPKLANEFVVIVSPIEALRRSSSRQYSTNVKEVLGGIYRIKSMSCCKGSYTTH